jgi:hypothetical protein
MARRSALPSGTHAAGNLTVMPLTHGGDGGPAW